MHSLRNNFFHPMVATFVLLVVSACVNGAGQKETVTIAVATQTLSAPLYIARERGFFKREGIDVTLSEYPVGKDALTAVRAGLADFGTAGDAPILFAVLDGAPVSILGTIADSDNYIKIVGRKDRGIENPSDLIGKRIAVNRSTAPEYYLSEFITFNRIDKTRILIVPMRTEDMATALVTGRVDAAVSGEPYASRQRERLGSNAAVLQNDKIYRISWHLCALRSSLEKRPETAKKLLRALLRAQTYIEQHPDEARGIMQRTVGGGFTLAEVNYDLRLEQTLILKLEDQARWAMRNRLTPARNIPNFLAHLYLDGLNGVNPSSVTVIHERNEP